MTSLHFVAQANTLEWRTEELKNATRVAPVVMELLETLDRHRGRGKQNVAVGQVTVESGGQAIVGNVNSEAMPSINPEKTEKAADEAASRENKVMPRGTRKVGSR